MRKQYFLVFALSFFGLAYSQGEVSVNFVEVKSKIESSDSETSYSKLLSRFNEFDSSLSLQDYSLVYYGFSFQDKYLNSTVDEFQLENILKTRDYEKLLSECFKVLEQNPVSLSANEKAVLAMRKLHRPQTDWLKYQKRYKKLLEAVAKSGDGKSAKTAIKVIYPADQRIILKNYFGIVEIHGQSLVDDCDKVLIEPNEKYKSKEIYFDISRKLRRQEELLGR